MSSCTLVFYCVGASYNFKKSYISEQKYELSRYLFDIIIKKWALNGQRYLSKEQTIILLYVVFFCSLQLLLDRTRRRRNSRKKSFCHLFFPLSKRVTTGRRNIASPFISCLPKSQTKPIH